MTNFKEVIHAYIKLEGHTFISSEKDDYLFALKNLTRYGMFCQAYELEKDYLWIQKALKKSISPYYQNIWDNFLNGCKRNCNELYEYILTKYSTENCIYDYIKRTYSQQTYENVIRQIVRTMPRDRLLSVLRQHIVVPPSNSQTSQQYSLVHWIGAYLQEHGTADLPNPGDVGWITILQLLLLYLTFGDYCAAKISEDTMKQLEIYLNKLFDYDPKRFVRIYCKQPVTSLAYFYYNKLFSKMADTFWDEKLYLSIQPITPQYISMAYAVLFSAFPIGLISAEEFYKIFWHVFRREHDIYVLQQKMIDDIEWSRNYLHFLRLFYRSIPNKLNVPIVVPYYSFLYDRSIEISISAYVRERVHYTKELLQKHSIASIFPEVVKYHKGILHLILSYTIPYLELFSDHIGLPKGFRHFRMFVKPEEESDIPEEHVLSFYIPQGNSLRKVVLSMTLENKEIGYSNDAEAIICTYAVHAGW